MRLEVLNNAVSEAEAGGEPARAELEAALRRAAPAGRVRFGRHERMLYATDASIYQVEPIGVVEPGSVEEAAAVVSACAAAFGGAGVAILPRGGGTALAGQTTNRAVVVDLSSGCRGIGAVEAGGGLGLAAGEASVWVEPGVPIDVLNAELGRRGSGLFFAPDPATTAQSTIGGNIGTNAAGARSIRYGRTSENLLGVEVALATGERMRLERGAGARDPRAGWLAAGVIEIVKRHAGLIRERFPRTLRQNAGYGLDRMLAQIDAGANADTLDLSQLVCGSEGTLAVTLGARLRLRPVPGGKGLALAAFGSLEAAIEAVGPILATGPSAVELVDEVVIEAARGNRECSAYVDAFPRAVGREGDPAAVLYVEYHEASGAAVGEKMAALRGVLGDGVAVRVCGSAAEMADAWKLRKAGEPLLHGLPGPRKPLTFVEDNAVPVENLARFVREFKGIVARAGTRAAFWAHASVGVLHVRPMLNPHDAGDLERLRRIAVEVADLARSCGGVMSGEHGDGRVRGPLLERYFGPELMRAFAEVKAVFDPKGLMNPGIIVGAGPVESITQRTRMSPGGGEAAAEVRVPAVETFFDYSAEEGFDHAVEMCNGSGVCRKVQGGTMCPSYRATLDERHSTRGRANALRLAITGQLSEAPAGAPAWRDAETMATLDLCLSCKACKTECPSNVDVAKLKAEFTAQGHRAAGRVPLAARLTGHVRTLNRLGAIMPGLANAVAGAWPGRQVIGAVMGLHPARRLPRFSRSLFRRRAEIGTVGGEDPAGAPAVVLFGDCFTAYNESGVGVAAGRVLRALGYRVVVLDAGCCGRSMLSVGMAGEAAAKADAALDRLMPLVDDASVKGVLFLEPSCLSAVKDDWLALKCRTGVDARRRVAGKSMLAEDFVDRAWAEHPRRAEAERAAAASRSRSADGPEVLVHAHCHQKALWGAETSARALRRFYGDRVRVLETGCCGMAGSFGYAREKYELSMRIARLPAEQGGLMPQVEARPGAMVAATGTSCRHQVSDASGGVRGAEHPMVLIARAMGVVEA